MPTVICGSAQEHLEDMGHLLETVDHTTIDVLADALYDVRRDKQKVIVFVNGGSVYTAGYFVTDQVKAAAVDRQPRLRAISLVDNFGLTTAQGNHNSQAFKARVMAEVGQA